MQLGHGVLRDHGGGLLVVHCEGPLASEKVEEAAPHQRLKRQDARRYVGSTLSVFWCRVSRITHSIY